MDFLKEMATKAQTMIESVNNPKHLTKDQIMQEKFHLPSTEKIINESIVIANMSSKTLKDNQEEVKKAGHFFQPWNTAQGKLTLTEKFLVFKSDDNDIDTFVFALSTIRTVRRVQNPEIVCIRIETRNNMLVGIEFTVIRSQAETFLHNFARLLKSETDERSKMISFQEGLYSEYLLAKNNKNSIEIKAPPPGGLGWDFKFPGNVKQLHDREKMKRWYDYFRAYGRNLEWIRNSLYFKNVTIGLPNRLRGEIWETSCGSIYLRYQNSDVYNTILVDNINKKSLAIEEIEKDLNRSLPEYPAYQTPEGINRLRRVLTAYSWKNPEIGYCQAMNIVTAALLIYMTEEQVFWILNVLCDKFIPGYYSRTMYGVLLDQKVFEGLVKKSLPIVGDHFTKYDIQLSIVSLPWFLSFFLNTMPLVYAFRVVDMLFLHGTKTLFQIGLAIIRVNGEKLLNCHDDGECIAVFKEFFSSLDEFEESVLIKEKTRSKFENLWEVAFKEFSVIDDKMIDQYRAKFKDEIFQGIETFVKRAEIRNLPKTPNINKEQLSNIYDRYYSVLLQESESAPNKGNVSMDSDSFEIFMSRLVDWVDLEHKTQDQTRFLKRLYKHWCNDDGVMTLESLVVGLNKLLDHDIMNSLSNFIALYDEKKDGKISRETVIQIAEDLIFITTPWRESLIFDDITNKAIESEIARKIVERRELLREEGVEISDDDFTIPDEVKFNQDKWKSKQSVRYLASGSNFLKLAFQYAQPYEDPNEPLINLDDEDDIDEKITHNIALDPTHPTYITASTFRMVILADDTYESFFQTQFWNSFHIDEKINGGIGVVDNIRGMFNNFLADGRRVAIEVRKRMDDATKNRSTSLSSAQSTMATDSSRMSMESKGSIMTGFTLGTMESNLSRGLLDRDEENEEEENENEGEEDDDFGNFIPAGIREGNEDTTILHDADELENKKGLNEMMEETKL